MNWTVGQRVAIYRPYEKEPSKVAAVEKVYKGGNVVVDGVRYRPSSNGYAHQTGEGYSRRFLRLLTPEVEREANRAAKRRLMRRLAKWLAEAEPDTVPDSILRTILDAHNAATSASQQELNGQKQGHPETAEENT